MMPAEFDVTGKVIFITGAGRGIGKGIAQVLAESGADIALNALTPTHVERLAKDIAAATGRRVVPFIASRDLMRCRAPLNRCSRPSAASMC
jgi:NAD(P)-dependent dehydrogenase (short-subunit alcohol dehydrogenase family)